MDEQCVWIFWPYGISQEAALYSHLKQLLMHLLKWYSQPERCQTGHSWESTIINARSEIAQLLDENPRPDAEAAIAAYEGQGLGHRGRRPTSR